MTTDSKTGFMRGRLRSFGFAWKGIVSLFRREPNAQVHLCAAVLVVLAGLLFSISALEWCVVVLCIGCVFMAEGFNTALECIADKVFFIAKGSGLADDERASLQAQGVL